MWLDQDSCSVCFDCPCEWGKVKARVVSLSKSLYYPMTSHESATGDFLYCTQTQHTFLPSRVILVSLGSLPYQAFQEKNPTGTTNQWRRNPLNAWNMKISFVILKIAKKTLKKVTLLIKLSRYTWGKERVIVQLYKRAFSFKRVDGDK